MKTVKSVVLALASAAFVFTIFVTRVVAAPPVETVSLISRTIKATDPVTGEVYLDNCYADYVCEVTWTLASSGGDIKANAKVSGSGGSGNVVNAIIPDGGSISVSFVAVAFTKYTASITGDELGINDKHFSSKVVYGPFVRNYQ